MCVCVYTHRLFSYTVQLIWHQLSFLNLWPQFQNMMIFKYNACILPVLLSLHFWKNNIVYNFTKWLLLQTHCNICIFEPNYYLTYSSWMITHASLVAKSFLSPKNSAHHKFEAALLTVRYNIVYLIKFTTRLKLKWW